MKLLFLAAAAMIAVPAAAQTTSTTPTDTSGQMSDDQMSTDQTTDGAMQDPAGGYMPSAPALSGTPQPGATVVFQPSKSPSEAYPPPAAMADYPWCKPGQTDDCKERENARGEGLHNQHR